MNKKKNSSTQQLTLDFTHQNQDTKSFTNNIISFNQAKELRRKELISHIIRNEKSF